MAKTGKGAKKGGKKAAKGKNVTKKVDPQNDEK
jgi:hypothetical protein